MMLILKVNNNVRMKKKNTNIRKGAKITYSHLKKCHLSYIYRRNPKKKYLKSAFYIEKTTQKKHSHTKRSGAALKFDYIV